MGAAPRHGIEVIAAADEQDLGLVDGHDDGIVIRQRIQGDDGGPVGRGVLPQAT